MGGRRRGERREGGERRTEGRGGDQERKKKKDNGDGDGGGMAGSLIGFGVRLASVMLNSLSLIDLVLWGIVAMIVQILVYFLVRMPMPRVSERIEAGEVAAGIWLGVASLVAGILNAASMTY